MRVLIIALLAAISYAQTAFSIKKNNSQHPAKNRLVKNEYIKESGFIFPKTSAGNPIPMTEEILKGTSLQPLPPDMIGTMYYMTNITNKIMNHLNITYWLSDGSLLGYVRHNKSQIPWSDDVDVYALLDDVSEKISRSMVGFFEYHNMEVWTTSFGYRICSPVKLFGLYQSECAMPFLDIFHMTADLDSGKIWFLKEETRWKYYDRCFFYREELFPLQKQVKFGPAFVDVPNNPVVYLTRIYGDDVFEFADLQVMHTSGHYELAPEVKVYFSSWLSPKYSFPEQIRNNILRPLSFL